MQAARSDARRFALGLFHPKEACHPVAKARHFGRETLKDNQRARQDQRRTPHTRTSGPLAGIRIVEFAGIGPGRSPA